MELPVQNQQDVFIANTGLISFSLDWTPREVDTIQFPFTTMLVGQHN